MKPNRRTFLYGNRPARIRGGAFAQVVQAKAREVAHQHIARQVALLEAGEVVDGLRVGAVEILAARLHLDQQDAGPEGIDKPLHRHHAS
jgi:hypothetical protein